MVDDDHVDDLTLGGLPNLDHVRQQRKWRAHPVPVRRGERRRRTGPERPELDAESPFGRGHAREHAIGRRRPCGVGGERVGVEVDV
jgi:hypothetical protein